MQEESKPLDLTERMKAVAAATDKLREFNERTQVKRDPAGRYIAIAFNTTTVMHWLRLHGIDPHRVKIITSTKDTRGIGHDLIAICFPDWGDRMEPEFHQALKILESRIIAYRYSDQDRPAVEKGRITGWSRIHREK